MSKPKMLPQFTLIVNPFFVAPLFSRKLLEPKECLDRSTPHRNCALKVNFQSEIFLPYYSFFLVFFCEFLGWFRSTLFQRQVWLGNELKYAAGTVIQLIFD